MRWEDAQRAGRETHIEKLRWATRLLGISQNSLRPGAWEDLKLDLVEFIGHTAPTLSVIDALRKKQDSSPPSLGTVKKDLIEKIKNMDRGGLRTLQDALRSFFQEFAGQSNFHVCSWNEGGHVAFRADSPSLPFAWAIYHLDPVVAANIALGLHIISAGIIPEQIRNCPICKALFLVTRIPRKDRNFYCSIKCSRLAATWRHRNKKTEELKKQLKSPRKQQRRHGSKVKRA